MFLAHTPRWSTSLWSACNFSKVSEDTLVVASVSSLPQKTHLYKSLLWQDRHTGRSNTHGQHKRPRMKMPCIFEKMDDLNQRHALNLSFSAQKDSKILKRHRPVCGRTSHKAPLDGGGGGGEPGIRCIAFCSTRLGRKLLGLLRSFTVC